eukprot:scaffold55703_cov36-Phaeocystis_antarctica.AAC.1
MALRLVRDRDRVRVRVRGQHQSSQSSASLSNSLVSWKAPAVHTPCGRPPTWVGLRVRVRVRARVRVRVRVRARVAAGSPPPPSSQSGPQWAGSAARRAASPRRRCGWRAAFAGGGRLARSGERGW